MATRTISAHELVTDDCVTDRDVNPLRVTSIRPDAMHGALIVEFDDDTDIYIKWEDQVEVQLPRPTRYAIQSVTTPSSGAKQLHTIIDLYADSALAVDDDGQPRATPSRATAALWRDVMNLAHHLGVEL